MRKHKTRRARRPGRRRRAGPAGVAAAASARVGLPSGFIYTVDFSMAYPYGNIGTYGKKDG